MRFQFVKYHARALLVAVSCSLLSLCCFGQNQTRVGVTTTNCTAQTIVGTSQCSVEGEKRVEREPKKKTPAVTPRVTAAPMAAEDQVVGGVKESEVDSFLANYGKPSREAARAVLNPTDENLAALLKQERSQLAVVAYSAQRRVELMQTVGAGRAPELSQADLPALIGMRLTVLVSSDCLGCDRVLPMVNQLVTEFPSVDARIGVIGLDDPKEFVVKTAAYGVYLPTARVSAERAAQLNIQSLPAIVAGDTRYHTEAVLRDGISNALDLERAVVQLRQASERTASSVDKKK